MDHTLESLKKNTVAELHEIAEGLEADKVEGHKSLQKDDLINLLSGALGIEAGEAEAAPEAEEPPKAEAAKAEEAAKTDAKADAAGSEKAKIKAQIQALKQKRAAAIEAHDAKQLKWTRLNIKRLKQKARRVSA